MRLADATQFNRGRISGLQPANVSLPIMRWLYDGVGYPANPALIIWLKAAGRAAVSLQSRLRSHAQSDRGFQSGGWRAGLTNLVHPLGCTGKLFICAASSSVRGARISPQVAVRADLLEYEHAYR